MKNLIFTLGLGLFTLSLSAQIDKSQTESEYVTESKKIVKIILSDGTEHVGVLLKQDENMVLIETAKIGKVSIPKYTIQEIIYLKGETEIGNLTHRDLLRDDPRFRRYVLTNSALPYKRGDVVVVFDLFGPKFNFGITDGLSAGISTSWITIPVLANIKYAAKVTDNFHLAAGFSAAIPSVVNFESGVISPFVTATIGNTIDHLSFGIQNHTVNGDFLETGLDNGNNFTSMTFAGTKSINRKYSVLMEVAYGDFSPQDPNYGIVFDVSFGFKYHPNSKNSYLFVLNGIFIQDNNTFESFPAPIPFFSWTRIL